MITTKNRNKNQYSFANINLLGKCNCNCYFCLGNDLQDEFGQYNNLNEYFTEWNNWNQFLDYCRQLQIKQIYITGQNTDALCYKHLNKLLSYLDTEGFFAGIRTNGLLATEKMGVINRSTTCFGDAVSYSIHTLDPKTMSLMTGRQNPPNFDTWKEFWHEVITKTMAKMRVAIVCTRYNFREIYSLIQFLSRYPNIQYIQIRKVSTDTRTQKLSEDMECFELLLQAVKGNKAFREICHIDTSESFARNEFEKADIYNICGKPVSFWRTVETSVNSINYFTNGVISFSYFIIEGYASAKGIELKNEPS